MRRDKVLISKTTVTNYQNENNFEHITIYLPQKYNDNDMLDYTIQLNVINSDGICDVTTLTNPTMYESKYKYEFPIPLKWIYVSGTIRFWLKFLKGDNVIGMTNEVCANISESNEIIDYIPETSLSLLDEWTLNMNNVHNEAQRVLAESEEINNNMQEVFTDISQMKTDIENISTNPPIIGNNGNWHIWDSESDNYIDSGIQAKLDICTSIKDNYWLMFGNESPGDA